MIRPLPAVAGKHLADGRKVFVKESRNGLREFDNISHVRRAICERGFEEKIRVPAPLEAYPDSIVQERLLGFRTFAKAWLIDPAKTARRIMDALALISELPSKGIDWIACPEVADIDLALLRRSNTLHHLSQHALQDEKIREIVAIPLNLPRPTSFVHGDFKPDNILVSENWEDIAIVDWENSGLGHPDLDVASLLAGLTFVSVRSVVKEKGTEWKRLSAFLRHVDVIEKSWISGMGDPIAFHSALVKYLFIRLCGYYNEVEQDDRCAYILKVLMKKYVKQNYSN
ncbi:aminoglycoside phosphotransferase family protein [Corynebacterium urogenitale]